MVGRVAGARSRGLLRRERAILYNLSGNVVEEIVDIAAAFGRGLEEGQAVLFRELLALLGADNPVLEICFVGD